MLVLTRKQTEELIIGNNVQIKILEVCGNRVRLGISAPNSVEICRAELCFRSPEKGKQPGNEATRPSKVSAAFR